MSITVIVVSHNSESYLPACLDSVAAQEGVSPEVIVVENASQDGSLELLQSDYPQVRRIQNSENLGFAAAVNQATAHTRAELVLLLNPDTVLLPGALAGLAENMASHPRAAAAAPRQWLDETCTWQWSTIPHPPHWRSLLTQLPGARRLGLSRLLAAYWRQNQHAWLGSLPLKAPYLSGACLLLRRQALLEVRGLDDSYFLFYEDADLSIRLRQAGWQLFLIPSAGIIHPAMGSVRQLPDQGREFLQASARRFVQRHADPLTRLLWTLADRRRSAPNAASIPTGGAQAAPTRSTLEWQASPRASAYLVEIAPDTTFLYAAAALVSQRGCEIPPALSSLAGSETFYWRASALDESGRVLAFCAQGQLVCGSGEQPSPVDSGL